jgi:hypothetical protein
MYYLITTTIKEFASTKRRGTEIIKAALESINIKTEIKKSRGLVDDICIQSLNSTYMPDKSIIRRIRILESFVATKQVLVG